MTETENKAILEGLLSGFSTADVGLLMPFLEAKDVAGGTVVITHGSKPAVDICEAAALSEYSLSADSPSQIAVSGHTVEIAVRPNLLTIGGGSVDKSSAFHVLYVDVFAAEESLGTLVLGQDLLPVMSLFEAEF